MTVFITQPSDNIAAFPHPVHNRVTMAIKPPTYASILRGEDETNRIAASPGFCHLHSLPILRINGSHAHSMKDDLDEFSTNIASDGLNKLGVTLGDRVRDGLKHGLGNLGKRYKEGLFGLGNRLGFSMVMAVFCHHLLAFLCSKFL